MEIDRTEIARLYAELSDEHLQDLARDPETLTDAGRVALAAELQARGLADRPARDQPATPTPAAELEQGFGPGIPGVFPAGAAVVEQALEPQGRTRDGMVSLVSFYDGLELGKACELLDAADLDPTIEQLEGDARNGAPPRYDIWVAQTDEPQARDVLRAGMGLFPPAEMDDALEENDGTVGLFDTGTEAAQVAELLHAQGFAASVHAPGDDDEEPAYTVTVDAKDQARALGVVAARMGIA